MKDGIVQRPSPNFGPRRSGAQPTLIVLHYTDMPTAEAALCRLCDPSSEVSAHYLVACDGVVTQLVAEEMRAWHAGVGAWAGQTDVNSRSIGIELDNAGNHPFAAAQMSALEVLLARLMKRWNISARGVIGHSDMAPGRKWDPGPHFDWARLARQGLAAPPEGAFTDHVAPETFLDAARQAGYTAPASFETVLSATRLRFAPWRKGPLCAADYRLGERADLGG
ncbi:MAG: N-acetylmuramoyl-L-alanine amidase [Pseudomonadota bacterium]